MNFGELTALIADDLVNERLSNVQIQNAINQATRFYSRKTFYFNTIKDTFTTVPNQEYYSLTDAALMVADLYTLQTVRYNNSEISVALRPTEDSTIEHVSPISQNYDVPRYYAYAQMQLRLFPTPKEVGTLTIIATHKIPLLTVDTATNVFLTYADELIRQAAKRYLAFNVLHDQGLGDRVAVMEAEEYASLLAETRARYPIEPMRSPLDLVILPSGNSGYDIVLDQ